MENKLLQALVAHYQARVSRAEANLMNYFNNSTGIGEHPDVVGEMVNLVDEISAARGSLQVLNSYVQPSEGAVAPEPAAKTPAAEAPAKD